MQDRHRYLVTGGCGFIGSTLVRELVRRGHEVRVLDDLSTGQRGAIPPSVELLVADVCDRAALGTAMTGVDGCFHLAAVSSVEQTRVQWLGGHHTNAGGTVCVLEAARDAADGPVPVVYASSAAVYGDLDELPLDEGSRAVPSSAYGADKLGGELHAAIASQLFAIPTLGLRFFNVYGPGQSAASPYAGVITQFCKRLLRGEPILIYGDGRQTRDFVYVDDVVRALVAGMERLPDGQRVLNVCTGRQTSILDIARTLAAVAGRPLQVAHEPARQGAILHSQGSPRRLRESLDVVAATSLERGLQRTFGWFADGASREPAPAGPRRPVHAPAAVARPWTVDVSGRQRPF